MAVLHSSKLGNGHGDGFVVDVDDLGSVDDDDEDDARWTFQQLSTDIVELHSQLLLEHERVVEKLIHERHVWSRAHRHEKKKARGLANGISPHVDPETLVIASGSLPEKPCPRMDPDKLAQHPPPPSPCPSLGDPEDDGCVVDGASSVALTAALATQVTHSRSTTKSVKLCTTPNNDDREVTFEERSPKRSNGVKRSSALRISRKSLESEDEENSMKLGFGAPVGRLAALQWQNSIREDAPEDDKKHSIYTTATNLLRHSAGDATLNRTVSLALEQGGIGRRGAVWIRNSQQVEDDRRRLAALAVGQEDYHEDPTETEEQPAGTFRSKVQMLVRGMQFEMFFAAVIISNSFFMGVQTEYTVSYPHDDPPWWHYACQFSYGIVFTVELLLRLFAEPLMSFLTGSQWHWNMLDIFIVLTSIFEMITDIIYLTGESASTDSVGGGISNLRIIRIIRITRLIRVFRVARIVRFIRALRTLVYSIICTLRSVVWALLLLFIIVYVTGMVFAQAASEYIADGNTKDAALIMKYWGSLPRSMFTLYKSVSGGVSWHDVVEPLSAISGFWVMVFLAFVSFTFFAVLNVITGVFCQSAIESAQHDQEMQVQAVMQNKTMYTKKIKDLFKDLDTDDSEYITFPEFERHFKDDKVKAYFASLEIDPADAWELFKLLDTNETGVIDVREFVMGCMRLRGQARAMHIAQLSFENRSIRKKLTGHIDHVEAQLHHLISTMDIQEERERLLRSSKRSERRSARRSEMQLTRSQTEQTDFSTIGTGQSWYDLMSARRSTVGRSTVVNANFSMGAAQVFRQ